MWQIVIDTADPLLANARPPPSRGRRPAQGASQGHARTALQILTALQTLTELADTERCRPGHGLAESPAGTLGRQVDHVRCGSTRWPAPQLRT